MAVEIFVTTDSSEEFDSINLPNNTQEFHETLGEKEEKIAVQIEELLDSILTHVQKSAKTECEVQVSISGKVSLIGKGDAKFIIFNIGGQSAKETTMTVTLKSKILPKI